MYRISCFLLSVTVATTAGVNRRHHHCNSVTMKISTFSFLDFTDVRAAVLRRRLSLATTP